MGEGAAALNALGEMAGVIAYIAGVGLAAMVADNNNRGVFGWLVMAIICTPLLALIALAALGKKQP